jgi:hypothetical protein
MVCELCGCLCLDDDDGDGLCGMCRDRLDSRQEELLGEDDGEWIEADE